MRFSVPLLSTLLFLAPVSARLSADILGGTVEFQPARGWVAAPVDHPSPFPTLKYVPNGGSNVVLLMSLLPEGNINAGDPATVRKLHLMLRRPYLPRDKSEAPQTEIKLSSGFAVYSVLEDPDLVGKPARRGDYKFAIPILASIDGKALVQATILCDEPAGAGQAEAWRFLRGMALAAKSSPTAAGASDAASGSPRFQVPSGFTSLDTGAAAGAAQFMYAGPEGILLSGWLDQASRFPGMRTFWAKEKASVEKGLGLKLENEAMEVVGGWSVVAYTVKDGDVTQQNLRACRIYGNTWVDVHLSQTGDKASLQALKAVLPKLGFSATP